MSCFAKSGNLELIVNSDVSEGNENLLHIGIQNGHLTAFDKDGQQISGITSIEILSSIDNFVTINIKCRVNKNFFISDSIIVRGEDDD